LAFIFPNQNFFSFIVTIFFFAEPISENPLSLLGQYSDDEEDDETPKSSGQQVLPTFYELFDFGLYCYMNYALININ
jgi:hypothetical protein